MDLYFDMLLSQSSPGSSFMDWFFKNCLFIFGLLDIVLHNWIIKACLYLFRSELKSGSPDCFAIADTTENGFRYKLNLFNYSLLFSILSFNYETN